MNHVLLILLMLLSGSSLSFAEKVQKYVVTGNVRGIDSGWVWMKQKGADGYSLVDSARIIDGKFIFKGIVDKGVQSVNLYFNKERGTLVLFLEPGKIKIEADKDSLYYAVVTGSPNNELWGNYVRGDRQLANEEERMSKLYQQSYATKNRNKVKAAEKAFSDAMAARKKLKTDFLSAPENRYVAACWYRSSLIHRMQFHEIDSVITGLGSGLEQNNDFQLMLKRRKLVSRQAVGQSFGNITLPDLNGELKSLAALKGKWILVDFWASWCGPCRREGKHVLELYHKYHSKGFEVFGVSIDQNTDHWKKAVQEEQTPWIHVCDNEGKIAKEYGITVIPHLFLINPEGIIEAVNIRGEELTKKLESVYEH